MVGEVDFVSSIFNALIPLGWGHRGENKFCWIPSKMQSFDVKTFYKVLIPNLNSPFPWKSIWRSKAPLRLVFFI
jgi:hypothetical protein